MSPSTLETHGRRLAYHFTPGKSPCVMFCGGFMSDMTGAKAMALEAFCQQSGQAFLRFDYSGHGQSSGTFQEGTIGQWLEDALAIFDHIQGKILLIGSSMGAWIALHIALKRPERLHSLVTLAAAPDFTENLLWNAFNDGQKKEVMEKGVTHVASCYGEQAYPITRALIEEGRKHLLLGKPLPIICPVRLIHGKKDEDVPWQVSQQIKEQLASNDVQLTWIEDGGHRLSEPDQLELLCKTVRELL